MRIHEEMKLGIVSLKVRDLEKMVNFYRERIGLGVLERSEREAVLGISQSSEPLLRLREIDTSELKRRTAGLYHTAFLLPTRKDLGNILYSLLVKKVSLQGASDHGYSEAIYLQDPEGNGIEIYRDKPHSEWDIKEDGRIEGITIEMDAEGVLGSREDLPSDRFPVGTTIGHVHLSVRNLKETERFYTSVLGLDMKSYFREQAVFFAANGYHHHIGSNNWLGEDLPLPEESDTGLEYFTVQLPNGEELAKMKSYFEENNVEWSEKEGELWITDPNGIQIKLEK